MHMKGGTPAALALGVGYLLGRRRKLKTATVLAAAAATGGLGSLGGAALRRGAGKLGSSEALGTLGPQLGEIAETIRGDLLDAGKAAAMAAVSNRIESLSDSLHDRAASVREPAGAAADRAGEAAQDVPRRGRRTEVDGERGERRRGRRTEPDDERGERADEPADYDEAEAYDEYDDDRDASEDGDEERPRRARPARDRSPVSRPRR
jgi:hypothetical protein